MNAESKDPDYPTRGFGDGTTHDVWRAWRLRREIIAAHSLAGWRAGGDVSPAKDIARLALDDAEAVMAEAKRRDEKAQVRDVTVTESA